MSYCINPDCLNRHNPDPCDRCQTCGTELIINERYRLVERLQENQNLGTEVWLGKDLEGRNKVLKILLGKKPTGAKLFYREAQTLAQLSHPGIPTLEYGISKGPHDIQFLVLDYIEGTNLDKWLTDHGPINQETALSWLQELTQILHYVHQAKIFHRDIKLSNIILTPEGKLVLIDFGAVRKITSTYLLKQEKGDETTSIYSPGGYTPQEQTRGHAVPQSDFFSLGRTFVYLLTGKRPDLSGEKKLEIPEDGRLWEWRQEVPELAPAFGDLLDRLMAFEPHERPQSTGKILQHLNKIDLSESPLPDDPSPQHSQGKRSKVSWKKVVGTTAALLVLFGSPLIRRPLALASNQAGIERHGQGQLHKAQKFYNLAILLHKDLALPYYNLGWMYDEDLADPAQAVQWYQDAAQRGLAEAHAEVARLRISQGDYEGALKSIYQCLKLTQYDGVKTSCLKNRAWIRLKQDRLKEAEEDVRDALKLREDSPHTYCLLAQILERQGQSKQANQAWKKVQQYSSYNVPEEDHCLGLAEKALL